MDVDKNIDIATLTPNSRVALRNDSYTIHRVLPNKVSLVTFAFHFFFRNTKYIVEPPEFRD